MDSPRADLEVRSNEPSRGQSGLLQGLCRADATRQVCIQTEGRGAQQGALGLAVGRTFLVVD